MFALLLIASFSNAPEMSNIVTCNNIRNSKTNVTKKQFRLNIICWFYRHRKKREKKKCRTLKTMVIAVMGIRHPSTGERKKKKWEKEAEKVRKKHVNFLTLYECNYFHKYKSLAISYEAYAKRRCFLGVWKKRSMNKKENYVKSFFLMFLTFLHPYRENFLNK